ncbi:O-antigen polymerase [Cupriavidus sp. BIS7]|uniref:O-antigen polymerase n=1 Tax=Cupriavidus sp. BIS7 TaxID=1217718 RepID=UPI0003049391|nr:O-antigen polymerase [Cupriavidus sp. BIS7]
MGTLLAILCILAAVLLLAAFTVLKNRKIFILSPVVIFSCAWAASSLIYLAGEDFLREDTLYVLLIFWLSFVVPGVWLTSAMGGHAAIARSELLIDQRRGRRIGAVLLAMQVLAAVSALSYLISAAAFAGMPLDAHPNMSALRGVLATQKYDVPLPFRLLSQLRYVNYIAPVAMLALLRAGHVSRAKVATSIVLASLYPICFLERSGLMRILILTLYAYLFMFEIKVAKLLRLGSWLVTLVAIFVVLMPIIRGQGEEGGGNLYNYVAGAWSGIDNFVSGSGSNPVVVLEDQDVFVQPGGYDVYMSDSPPMVNLMTEAYRICNAVGLCHVKLGNFGEYVYEPVYTNIYTAARSFYQDLGLLGMIPAVIAVSFLFAIIYLWAVRNGAVIAVYAAGYVAYTCVMSVLSDTFLLRDLAFPLVFICALTRLLGARELWFGGKAIHQAQHSDAVRAA